MKSRFSLSLPFVLTLALTACGSGSGSSGGAVNDNTQPQAREGQFVDNPVEGLEFSSSSHQGLTTRQGSFPFRDGDIVRLTIGEVLVGEAEAAPVLTPLDFSPGGRIDDNIATNISRTLLTLDADCDAANGLHITAQARQAGMGRSVNFDQSPADFSNDPAVQDFINAAKGACPELKTAQQAREHLQTTLDYMAANNGQPNNLPTAEAGPDLTVNANTVVTLDGSVSSDPEDGAQITFTWIQTGGAAVALEAADTAHPSFITPEVSEDTVLIFQLTVSDSAGAAHSDAVIITVRAEAQDNQPPEAEAGFDQLVNAGEKVTLDGSASSDPEDGNQLQYQWLQSAGAEVTLAQADTAQATFTAPQVDADSDFQFKLRVTDSGGLSSEDSITVTVMRVDEGVQAPEADAGPDRDVAEETAVILDGSASSDPQNRPLSYNWTQLAGDPVVDLENANTSTASFNAPAIAGDRVLTFQLTVTNDGNAVDTDTVQVTIRDDTAVSIDDAFLVEGNEDSTAMVFEVKLSTSQPEPVSLNYATRDGSATAGADYVASSDSLRFEPGETKKTISVDILGDVISEDDEHFFVALTNIANAGVDRAEARGTIIDDDKGLLFVGAAKRTVTPSEKHIEGVEEPRLGGTTHKQKFNLGGYGLDPTQNFPDPIGGFGDMLTEPAGQPVFENSAGHEEHTWLRAIVISERQTDGSDKEVAFVTLDAVGAGNVISNNLKKAVSDATGIGPNDIVFGQTHTHAGADLQGLWGGVPQDWIDSILYEEAVAAVREAQRNRCRAALTVAQGEERRFNSHRRGDTGLGHEPDPHLTLLQARCSGAGEPIASLLQYSAHPTSITASSHESAGLEGRVPHADYILGAVEWLEADGGIAVYYNGPIAEAAPSGRRDNCNFPEDGSYGGVRCRGEGIAESAEQLTPRVLEPSLTVDHRIATLPVTNPAFIAAGVLGSFNRYYDFLMLPTADIPVLGAEFQYLPQFTPTATTPVSRITIGGAKGLEIVTIPGEATNTFGQYIRSLADPDAKVMLMGLTQQSFGYIIPENEFAVGEALVLSDPYEEIVSLGPLTAPLLRMQAYNPLFGIAQDSPDNLPPWLSACENTDDPNCILNEIGRRLGHLPSAYEQACLNTELPEQVPEEFHDQFREQFQERFCALFNPDMSALGQACREAELPEASCAVFGDSGEEPGDPDESGIGEVDLVSMELSALLRGCDPLDTANCLLPFPSNHFTRTVEPDQIGGIKRGGTGRRVNFNPLAMPRNIAGKPIDPSEWNRNDGFSPGQMLVTFVPDVALVRDAEGNPTGPIVGAPAINDQARYLDPETRVMVINADTGERHPIWVEIDVNAGFLFPPGGDNKPQATQAALIIRPARNFDEGVRYVAVLRNLQNEADEPIPASDFFAACRDGYEDRVPAEATTLRARCKQLVDEVFPVVSGAGVAMDDSLYLAWDFTIASTDNNIGRLRHMRDDAFKTVLGQEEDPLTGEITALGNAPDYRIYRVLDEGDYREVHGSMTVPSYLTPQAPISTAPVINLIADNAPGLLAQAVDECRASFPISEFCDALQAMADGADDLAGLPTEFSAPPNRLAYNPGDAFHPDDPEMQRFGDGLPDRTGDMAVPFMCRLYDGATPDNPARAGIYGHGLLDQRRAITYDQVPQFSRNANFMFCAVDWFGFATGDTANVASTLLDLSQFPVVPDASQQGMLNQLFLARLLRHPQGLAANPVFQQKGRPRFANDEIFYHGISQGGILGGVVLALSKDISRGLLGVPGMNYSTLLRRSTGFSENIEDPVPVGFSTPLYLAYPDDLDRNLAFSLMQMLWDRSENNGYAHHITDNSALKGPNNEALLRPAFADHQVTHWSADVMARTLGVDLADVYPRRPAACPNQAEFCFETREAWHEQRNPDVDLLFGMPLANRDVSYDPTATEMPGPRSLRSGIIHWDKGLTATPPIGEIPANWKDTDDPHKFPRDAHGAFCQQSHFLHDAGRLIDVRPVIDGAPCPALPASTPTGVADETADSDPWGEGVFGAIAQFGQDFNAAFTTLLAGDFPLASSYFSDAFSNLGTNLVGLGASDPSDIGALIGLHNAPQGVVEELGSAQRDSEPVVITGDKIPGWAVPAAYGLPYPYPSGVGGDGEAIAELFDGFQDAVAIGVRSAHNGVLLYPGSDEVAQAGVDIRTIAAYRYDPEDPEADVNGFLEIPVQIDEKMPYFLANSNSDFSFYSGTDEEISYVWDTESWGMTQGVCEREYDRGQGNSPDPGVAGPTPDPIPGLDFDDEIVFMASDAGPRGPDLEPNLPALPVAATAAILLTIIDPLAPDDVKTVYLVQQDSGSSFTTDNGYVNYRRDDNANQWIDRGFFAASDPEKIGSSNTGYGANLTGPVCVDDLDQYYGNKSQCVPRAEGEFVCPSSDRFPRDGVTVTTDNYQWYASGRWMVRNLKIRAPGDKADDDSYWQDRPDLIDRWKGRAFQQSPDSTISVVGFEDEQVNWEANASLLGERCGPVRCIRETWGADSGTNVTKTETFYRDAITYRYRVRVHPIPPDGLYTSWDYNRNVMIPTAEESANGVQHGRYFTLLRPQGVLIDGVNDDFAQIDTVPAFPGFDMCLTTDGPQDSVNGGCPVFFDTADPTFNLPLAFNNWEQVSGKGDSGSMVYSFEIKGLTSLATPVVVPYYRDDGCLDDGTGDDPVSRPFPGKSSSDADVINGYSDLNGDNEVRCEDGETQGAYGAHGIHYFFTGDVDNAFVLGKPINEIDGQQWQFIVPTEQPTNVGTPYANIVRAPLQVVAAPLSLPPQQ